MRLPIVIYLLIHHNLYFVYRTSIASITASSATMTNATNTNTTTTSATPTVRRPSVAHTTLMQSRAQHLPNLTQVHKARVYLHIPSTLPTLPHNKQAVSRVRKPAAPACLKEHTPTSEGKMTKKVITSFI